MPTPNLEIVCSNFFPSTHKNSVPSAWGAVPRMGQPNQWPERRLAATALKHHCQRKLHQGDSKFLRQFSLHCYHYDYHYQAAKLGGDPLRQISWKGLSSVRTRRYWLPKGNGCEGLNWTCTSEQLNNPCCVPGLYDMFQTPFYFWLIPEVLGPPALTSPYCTIVLLSCKKIRMKSWRHCTRPQARSAVEILEPLKFTGSMTINIGWLAQDAWSWIPFKLQSCSIYESSFFKDPERLWRRARNDFIQLQTHSLKFSSQLLTFGTVLS